MNTLRFKAPVESKLAEGFWEAARGGRLAIQHCCDCGQYIHYPTSICDRCLSDRLEWKTVSGKGTVESFSIVHRAFSDEFAADVPYTVVIVRLDEGVLLLSWLVGVAGEPTIGMPVEVTFESTSDRISLHRFRPIA